MMDIINLKLRTRILCASRAKRENVISCLCLDIMRRRKKVLWRGKRAKVSSNVDRINPKGKLTVLCWKIYSSIRLSTDWSLWRLNCGTYINLKLPEYKKGSVCRLVRRWIDTRGHQVTYHKSEATERTACNINKIHCTLLLFTSFNWFDTLQHDGRTVIGWARCHCSSKNIPLASWMRKTHARSQAGHTEFRNKVLVPTYHDHFMYILESKHISWIFSCVVPRTQCPQPMNHCTRKHFSFIRFRHAAYQTIYFSHYWYMRCDA